MHLGRVDRNPLAGILEMGPGSLPRRGGLSNSMKKPEAGLATRAPRARARSRAPRIAGFFLAKRRSMLAPMRLLACLVLVTLCACAYPRRATHVTPAPAASVSNEDRPEGMYTFELIEGEIPPRKPTGLNWDDDGSGPDPFVRLYIGDRMVWESPVLENTLKPTWHATLPRNLIVPRGARFRIEVLDRDSAVTSDPIGSISRDGLPENVLPDAQARLTLDTLATVTVRITDPRPTAGVGLEVEIHPDALVILSVTPHSPAARAGLHVGDRVVGIGPQRVAHMSDEEAFSGLSLAVDRQTPLSVSDQAGHERDVTLDKRPLWQVL